MTIQAEGTADLASGSYTAVRTVGAGLVNSVNEIRMCNKSSNEITVDLELWPSGTSGSAIRMAKSQPIPPKSPLVAKGYRSLIASDEIRIQPSASSALDVYVSYLEYASTGAVVQQGIKRNVSASGTYDELITGTSNNSTVNDLMLFNHSAGVVEVSVQVWPLGVSGNAIQLVIDQPLRPNEPYELIGVTNLEFTDQLRVTASAASSVDAICSAVTEAS